MKARCENPRCRIRFPKALAVRREGLILCPNCGKAETLPGIDSPGSPAPPLTFYYDRGVQLMK